MKICIGCGVSYPATTEYFHIRHAVKCGLNARCKACNTAASCAWARANPEKANSRSNKWKKAHSEQRRESQRRLRAVDPEKHRAAQRMDYQKKKDDPRYKISRSMKRNIWTCLKREKSGWSWESLVGYSRDDLMKHLESQFQPGMTWGNYGEWHIDHIRPVADFNFKTPDDPDFAICWSLWNLQPLWAFDNKSKHDHCINPPLPLLNNRDEVA